MSADAGPGWSEETGEADWLRERLAPFGSVVTSVVPAGFAAYARVLHPAGDPRWDAERLVRWAEVAAWSGRPLRGDSQFHSIALPPVHPQRPAPWSGEGPRPGSLYPPDAAVVAGIVKEWTGTPGRCWFCVWDGYGWGGSPLAAPGEQPGQLPDPVPARVRGGKRVRLPGRDYLLYAGPAEAVTAPAVVSGNGQTANLWWPADRAWCVASEIDLHWTYVGGPAGLIGRLVADRRIEALPAGPDDPLNRTEAWVTAWVEQATAALLASGHAVISTSRGTVEAWLERPASHGSGWLVTRSTGDNGLRSGSRSRLRQPGDQDEICRYLTCQVTGLAGE